MFDRLLAYLTQLSAVTANPYEVTCVCACPSSILHTQTLGVGVRTPKEVRSDDRIDPLGQLVDPILSINQ